MRNRKALRREPGEQSQRSLSVEALETRRVLATFAVSNLSDAGAGSLRQAIVDANAAATADEIEFQSGLTGTISLTTGELTISDELTINGPGSSDLSVDAGGMSRVFAIDDGASTFSDVEINGLTITGGQAATGGGIHSFENLTLDAVVVSGNRADLDGGGVQQGTTSGLSGSLTIRNSQITGNTSGRNAAALDVVRTEHLVVESTEISGNQSGDTVPYSYFGAVRVRGPGGASSAYVLFDGVSLTNNTIVSAPGASNAWGNGAAFTGNNYDMTVEIRNSTFSGNSSARPTISYGGGGLFADYVSSLRIADSTISGNSTEGDGGGIFATRTDITLMNATISNNTAGDDAGGITTNKDIHLIDSTISNNLAQDSVGGLETYGQAVLERSHVTGNSAASYVGGLYSGGVGYSGGSVSAMLTDSTVTGNSSGNGIGGILTSFDLTLTKSTVSGNSTGGDGGGILVAGDLTGTESSITGNTALGYGGGVWARNGVTFTRTTVNGNRAFGQGGGLFKSRFINPDAPMTLTQSTVSGNTAGVAYGGIFGGTTSLTLAHSTVTGNSAGSFGGGVGVVQYANIIGSIVAGNTAGISGPDLRSDGYTPSASFSLIGDNSGSGLDESPIDGTPDLDGNYIGGPVYGTINPLLGLLADNGGPTYTHALLTGSPAIDSGDPSAIAGVAGVPEFDQRGMPYGRVEDGDGSETANIDMGAFEVQPAPGPPCDFDGDDDCDIDDIDALVMEIVAGTDHPLYDVTGDGFVDLADRDHWLVDAGALNLLSGNPYLLGDSNLDGIVDGQDFLVWNAAKFTPTGAWSAADWNADGITDGHDFLIWNGNKFQSSDSDTSSTTATTVEHVNDPEDTIDLPSQVRDAVRSLKPRRPIAAPPWRLIDRFFAGFKRYRDDSADRAKEVHYLAEALSRSSCDWWMVTGSHGGGAVTHGRLGC